MDGVKPQQLSKEFRVAAKKVYKTIELFKNFSQFIIMKQEDGVI